MKSADRNYGNILFCSLHFEDDAISGTNRKRLKCDAVPSKCLEWVITPITLIFFVEYYICYDQEYHCNCLSFPFKIYIQENSNGLLQGDVSAPSKVTRVRNGSYNSKGFQPKKRRRITTTQTVTGTSAAEDSVTDGPTLNQVTKPPTDGSKNQELVVVDPLIIENPVINPLIEGDSQYEPQLQGTELSSLVDQSTAVLPPELQNESSGGAKSVAEVQMDVESSTSASVEKLLRNLIEAGKLNVTALVQEEQERASHEELDLTIPSTGPNYVAQMILWNRFQRIFQAGKVRLRLSRKDNDMAILALPPITAIDSCSVSTSVDDDSSIDINDLNRRPDWHWPLPSVIQELLNPNAILTQTITGPPRFALLLCNGFRWELMGCFLEPYDSVAEEVDNSTDQVIVDPTAEITTKAFAEINAEGGAGGEDETEGIVPNGNLLELSVGSNLAVHIPKIEALEEQMNTNQEQMNERLKEIQDKLSDFKTEFADRLSSHISFSPRSTDMTIIQPFDLHNISTSSFYPKVRLVLLVLSIEIDHFCIFMQMKGKYPTLGNRLLSEKLKKLRKTKEQLSSKLKESVKEKEDLNKENDKLMKENEKLAKENFDLMKEKEEWIKEGNAVKMQFCTLDQGNVKVRVDCP